MTLNHLEIDQIITELNLKGSTLQKVKAINYESFTLFFYKPGEPINLLVSMDKNCRIHSESKKQTYMGKPHNLVEFLKAYIVGGKVNYIKQVDSNRIIEISILKNGIIFYLIIRLWGGFPNIIITDHNYKILHLHKKSSKKQELPGLIFKYPESKPKIKNYELKSHDYSNYNNFIEAEFEKIINETKEEKLRTNSIIQCKKRLNEINPELKKLYKRVKGYNCAEEYKLKADLILSNIHLIKRSDTNLETINYLTGEPIIIPLNPELKPDQNSQKYYKKYQKAIRGLEVTNKLIVNLKKEKELLESGDYELLTTKQPNAKKEDRIKEKRPGLHYKSGDWDIIVGRTAKENEILLRRWVKGNDMWLHIRDYPGAYVFIKSKKEKTIPLDILIDAGNLALFYSKGKSNGKADIFYTHVKYLRKIKNGKPGQVIPTMNKNLFIKLDKNRLESIKP